ncbi:hypothetical protein B0H14DRAFT_3854797 [Mycena olivaceomarginata]|nr:hypothetical protein B0H14DRAFT_3854797 [Mycena olivaceomarginata]
MRLVPMAPHPVAPIPVVLRGRARVYLYSSHRVPAPLSFLSSFACRRSLRSILLVHVDAGTLVHTIFVARHSQSVSPRTTNLRALSHAAPLPPLPARLRSLTSPIASLRSSDCLPPPVLSLESISSTSLTYVRISPSLPPSPRSLRPSVPSPVAAPGNFDTYPLQSSLSEYRSFDRVSRSSLRPHHNVFPSSRSTVSTSHPRAAPPSARVRSSADVISLLFVLPSCALRGALLILMFATSSSSSLMPSLS